MATADLTRLMANIRINLPGALDSAIKLELFNTLDEFFTLSKCWTEDIEFTLISGRADYEITESEPGTIITLMSLVNANDIPVAGSMEIPGTVVLNFEPTTVEVLTAKVALTASDPVGAEDYPQMPDWLLKKYYAGLLDGVIGKMMAQVAKPYTNERMGIFHIRRFRGAIATARADARNQNVYDGQRWRFPHYAGGSQR